MNENEKALATECEEKIETAETGFETREAVATESETPDKGTREGSSDCTDTLFEAETGSDSTLSGVAATPAKATLREKYGEVISLAIGEAAVILLTVLGFVIYNLVGEGVELYTAILGAVLGGLVTVGNMLILSVSVNRAVNRYLEIRGTKEMTDEEAEKFAADNAVIIQGAVTRSYLIRTVSMVAVLAGALLLSVFNVLATVIPLIMYRPLMYISELIKKRRSGS